MTHAYRLTSAARDAVCAALGDEAQLAAVAARASVEARFVAELKPLSPAPLWHRVALAGARRRGVAGITLGRVVYVAGEAQLDDWPLLVHEAAHVAQVCAMNLARFLGHYGWDYLALRLDGLDDHEAYLGIDAERQARRVEARARELARPARPWLERASHEVRT